MCAPPPPPPPTHPPKVFAGRLNARGTRTRLPRRAGGAWPARLRRETLERRRRRSRAALYPSCHMSHRTGAPLERGGGGGSKVLAVCHPTLALRRSSKHALHRASRAAGSTRRLRHPHSPQETTCAVTRGAHVGARARSAPAFGAERVLGGGTAPSSPQTLRPERCEIGTVWDGKGRSAQHPLHK